MSRDRPPASRIPEWRRRSWISPGPGEDDLNDGSAGAVREDSKEDWWARLVRRWDEPMSQWCFFIRGRITSGLSSPASRGLNKNIIYKQEMIETER